MKEIKQEELGRLFELSGLKVSNKEVVTSDLQEILSHFQKIQEIDTKGISSLVSPLEGNLSLRKDSSPVDFSEKEEALEQAPQREGKLIKVPLVT